MSEGGDIRCKAVIIGEQLVGKTCIVNRFVNDTFNHTPQTVGAGYESKTFAYKFGIQLVKNNIVQLLQVTLEDQMLLLLYTELMINKLSKQHNNGTIHL